MNLLQGSGLDRERVSSFRDNRWHSLIVGETRGTGRMQDEKGSTRLDRRVSLQSAWWTDRRVTSDSPSHPKFEISEDVKCSFGTNKDSHMGAKFHHRGVMYVLLESDKVVGYTTTVTILVRGTDYVRTVHVLGPWYNSRHVGSWSRSSPCGIRRRHPRTSGTCSRSSGCGW